MENYKKLLKEFIAIKSISTSGEYKSEINRAAAWLQTTFTSNGFEVEVIEGYDNPIVVASYVASSDYETCLIYGHYDVQPAQKEDGWVNDPFDLTERDGRLYARGAIDNKGQVLIHMSTVFELIKENKLKYNIKFMIEGNEETGSPHITQFLEDNKDKLAADFVVLSDGEIKGDYPTIAIGFRGGFNTTLEITSSSTDLHSGLYGGAAPNSATEMAKFIAGLYNPDGSITIPGFYEDVDEITSEIEERNKKLPFDLDEYKRVSGTQQLLTEEYDFYTQTGLRPAVITTGLQSGYTGEGYRNGVPSKTIAKINFRLVKSQNPQEIMDSFVQYVKSELPSYIDYTLDTQDPYDGIKLNPDNNYIKKAEGILLKVYGKDQVVFEYSGGGLPIVTLFDELMGIPQVIVNLANEDCGMHAPNENFNLDIAKKGMAFSKDFFSS